MDHWLLSGISRRLVFDNRTYDPQTYRLTRLSTVRASDQAALQGLHYHYDPVGNITDIRDTAQQTVYFQNAVIEAANSYEYDALYRLVEATGREHATQGTTQRIHEQLPVGPQPMTSDPSAMRRYTQRTTYDGVGNILKMQHIPASGTRLDAPLRVRRKRRGTSPCGSWAAG